MKVRHDLDANRKLDPLHKKFGLGRVAIERRNLWCARKPLVLNVVGKFHAAQLNRAALHIGISGCGHEPER